MNNIKGSLAHGSYHLTMKDKTIISKSFGSWNDVTIKNFIKEYKDMAISLTDQPWAGVVDVTEWQLATHDAEVLAKEFEIWCSDHNRMFVAIVGSSPMIKFQLTRSGLSNQSDKMNVSHFSTTTQAYNWLKECDMLH